MYKTIEIEKGAPKLIMHNKLLNKILKWIRYYILNKKYLLKGLHQTNIFNKFDLNYQIYINKNK